MLMYSYLIFIPTFSTKQYQKISRSRNKFYKISNFSKSKSFFKTQQNNKMIECEKARLKKYILNKWETSLNDEKTETNLNSKKETKSLFI